MVAFSRHTAVDEQAAHERVSALMTTISEVSASYGGRVVSTAGDAALVDFSSVVDALNAAITIQKELGAAVQNGSDPNVLQLRIGINLGDVIIDGDDIFGDGVNVAQRLQTLADPGGIAIAEPVYLQVKNKLDVDFEDRGMHRTKPHDPPIRVFAVVPDRPRRRPAIPRRWSRFAVGLVVLMGVISATAFFMRDSFERLVGLGASPQAPTASAPDATASGKPMVAVLPFEDRSPAPKPNYFSDGVTEDIITVLGRYSDLRVLSWNAVSPYKKKSVDLKQLSKSLNVRYVVGGSLVRTGESLRVNLQLTDARRGLLLWAESFDEKLENLFAVQDQVARKVATAITTRVTGLERQRVSRRPTKNLDAYELVLKGRELLRQQKRRANFEARALFEQAAKLDPNYSAAYEAMGWTYFFDYLYGWAGQPDRSVRKTRELAEKAIAVGARNARAHALIAYTFLMEGRLKEAKSAVNIALEINPSSAAGHAVRGQLLLRAGQPEKAVAPMEFAIRLDPNPEAFRLFTLSQAYYFLKRYRDVVTLLTRYGSDRIAEDAALYAMLAAAQAQLGNLDDARRMAANVRKYSPFFNTKRFVEYFANDDQKQHLLDGLRKAGLK